METEDPTCHLYFLGVQTCLKVMGILRKYQWLMEYSMVYHSKVCITEYKFLQKSTSYNTD